ncbi:Bud site selection protein bud4 [Coemansia sp. Benny D115]|nr:Bud site selection protein bud4 [Coemansia sp. Benny D115]
MAFGHPQNARKMRRTSAKSDSSFDDSDGEEIPDSVIGPIEIPKAPSHAESRSRRGSTPGMKAPTHIDFSASSNSPRHSFASGSAPLPHSHMGRFMQQSSPDNSKWPPQLYKQWFGAITEGRSIQVHSILADHPDVLGMRRKDPTPFHMALTHIASEWLGNDTTGMDGLQVAIMGYKNAYANWRLGNGVQSEQMVGMSADQMKEHVAVREVILGALIDAISPEQLDSHFFGRQQNTTLHLAAFYNDANLVERLLRQGAAVDIPNRMGFLPSGITNDKPTLQWLAMYQGQLRGTRYQTQSSPPQEQMKTQAGLGVDHYDTQDPLHHHHQAGAEPGPEPELEMEMENFDMPNDEDVVSESSYIKQFGDHSREMQQQVVPNSSGGYGDHDSVSISAGDEAESDDGSHADDQADNVSVASSNDRRSLGLGGIQGGLLAKSSVDSAPLRQRVLDNQLPRKDESRSSPTTSTGSDTAHSRPHSPSVSPSVMSYYTAATGITSDDGMADRAAVEDTSAYPAIDATIRIKVDPNSINDDEIEDIFSDTDDVVQMEPSFCQNGSGLSDSRNQFTSERSDSPGRAMSAVSSSNSINMQSLNSAMLNTPLLAESRAPASGISISAFPVSVPEVVLTPQQQHHQPLLREALPKQAAMSPNHKQQELVSKDGQGQMARPSSPFLLRDSLYEMIMGRSPSRASLASLASGASNTISNSSTIGITRDHPTLAGAQPTSPTSPTSMSSQLSPQSTSFEDPNSQQTQSQTQTQSAQGSPPKDSIVAPVAKPRPKDLPIPEDLAQDVFITPTDSLPEEYVSAPTTGVSHSQGFVSAGSAHGPPSSDSDSGSEHGHENEHGHDAAGDGFDTRASSPVPAPRPTAASLFSFMQSAEPEQINEPTPEPSTEPSPEPDVELERSAFSKPFSFTLDTEANLSNDKEPTGKQEDQFPPLADAAVFKAGRIGRRQGRSTVDMLQEGESTGFSSEPTFNFVTPKLSTGSLADKSAARTDCSEGEGTSPQSETHEIPSLPANVPLTRDKRDQYLQTLINRNTMRGAGPGGSSKGKRPAAHTLVTHAMRAASPARSFSSAGEGESGDDGDAENEFRGSVSSRASRHVSIRSEGNIDASHLRPSSSHNTREALAVSGASINGRIRANTVTTLVSPVLAPKPLTPTRKISPSLATLKTRSLVSNSPAKLGSPTSAESPTLLDASSKRVPALSSSPSSIRVRAMSTPAEARPPSSLSQAGGNSARIGRVAALSQNFERQQTTIAGAPPKIAIPGRASTGIGMLRDASDKHALGAASAPLNGKRTDFGRPVVRSSSISSSHSTGAHGQATTAGAGQSNGGGNQHREQQEPNNQPLSPDGDGQSGGSGDAGRGNGRGNGGDSGDEESSPSLSVSVVEPGSTDSNGSTTTNHTGSNSGSHSGSTSHGRGLAANIDQSFDTGFDSAVLDSRGSAELLGSSIFSSSESPSPPTKDPLPIQKSEASSGLHAPVAARREVEAERRSRFKEAANRRKSGTLERISNRGLVKSRKALIDSGDRFVAPSPSPTHSHSHSSVKSSGSSSSRLSSARTDKKTSLSTKAASPEMTALQPVPESFFVQQGEGRAFQDASADAGADEAMLHSFGSVEASLEEEQQASVSALHPGTQLHNTPVSYVDTSVGRSGIDTDAMLERSLMSSQPHVLDSKELDASIGAASRGSSSGKSRGGESASFGEDSIHILSSLDTLSTPESTPLDSTQENTSVGLMAQYSINQKRMDRKFKHLSGDSDYSYLSSGQDSQPPMPDVDAEFGFGKPDVFLSESFDAPAQAADVTEDGGSEEAANDEYGTLMPVRQRYNPRALFGLSTVIEEDEESRNPSMVAADPAGSTSQGPSADVETMPSAAAVAAAMAAFSQASSSGPSETQQPAVASRQSMEMQERRRDDVPARGLRSALLHDQHASQQALPEQALADSIEIPVFDEEGSDGVVGESDNRLGGLETGDLRPEDFEPPVSGAGWSTPQADDDTHSHAPSFGSHSFDANIVFGYTSEENNSTMASRSSFDRSDIFGSNRPGSSASRVLYMQPFDQPASEVDVGYTGDSETRNSRTASPLAPTSRAGAGFGFGIAGSSTGPRRAIASSSLGSIRFDVDDVSSMGSSESIPYVGKGKAPVRTMPEMEQVQNPVKHEESRVQTVEEIEEDLTTDEEPIPMILYLESQEFEGYVPVAHKIQEYREELRREKRLKKEAAKKGLPPPKPEPSPKMISPLWFIDNNYVDPLPPELMQMMIAERDQIMVENMAKERVTENPDRKRLLEAASISSVRLRQELDEFMAEDEEPKPATVVNRGTIKPLAKRPRVSNISTMFDNPPNAGNEPGDGDAHATRKSFLDSVEIPVSDLGVDSDSDDSIASPASGIVRHGVVDEAFVSPISQEFQVPGHEYYREPVLVPNFQPVPQHRVAQESQQSQTPRKRLVLRAKGKTFSERVFDEVNSLNLDVKTDNRGTVNTLSAGRFAYEPPMGTVRPSTIPQYVSQLNGVPAGPFFMPPKASAKSGYLYMRILGIEEIEDRTDSVYFVIRNGIDTLATTPVAVNGGNGTTINQEFRILTDPSVSITMWMRFRSDAIIYKGVRGGANMSGRRLMDSGCVPPLLRKLVRRNTRSRNNNRGWNCSSSADSVFDFDEDERRFAPGARRDGGASRLRGFSGLPRRAAPQPHQRKVQGDEFPERVSSALMSQSGVQYNNDRGADSAQQTMGAFNDPRSLNATQAPSSVFYEPGSTVTMDHPSSNKGLAQAKFKEDTRGVAVVHVGEMIEEVFLRGLVDSWDVENVWESRKGARLQLQLFYIPECPLFREEELPKTLSECEMAMEVCNFHNRTLNSGYMSQRGGDTRFWRRRYFRLIGGFLFAYHEDTKEPRCFIDLNDATRIVDHHLERSRRVVPSSPMASRFGSSELARSGQMRRRPTHKRNNSDHSSRDGAPAASAGVSGVAEMGGARHLMPGHGYASDSEPADMVDIADPALQQSTMRRRRNQQHHISGHSDSGVISLASNEVSVDSGMQHSFSIEFGEGGAIEFYTESESEKRVWVEIIRRIIGSIPKIPSWLIKLLHADVSEHIDGSSMLTSESSLPTNISTPSSKFQEMTRPHALY